MSEVGGAVLAYLLKSFSECFVNDKEIVHTFTDAIKQLEENLERK